MIAKLDIVRIQKPGYQKTLPFRDHASQLNLRPITRNLKTEPQQSQEEPQAEPEPAADGTYDAPLAEEDDMILLPEEVVPEPVVTKYCSMDEYQSKWDRELAKHSRSNDCDFAKENLIPMPIPNLWQNAPYVAFAELKSTESQSRLSVCRPFSAFEHPHFHEGVPKYSSLTGEINFRRRATRTLASMMGFILNKHDGSDMRNLKAPELRALHEVLSWCRRGTNNKTLQMYAASFENFHAATGKLMDKIRTVLPEGSTKCRIRLSKRESHTPSVSTLRDSAKSHWGWYFWIPVAFR